MIKENWCVKVSVLTLMICLGLMVNFEVMAVYQIHYAARVGDFDSVRKYIDLGEDINSLDQKYGHTPLCYAALGGFIDIAKLLLEKGADVNLPNLFTDTPLHIAAQNGKENIVELLLKKGAQVSAKNRNGVTPLEIARQNDFPKIIQLLKEHGAKE